MSAEFNALLEAHLPGLRRYARALTQDREARKELLQDTLTRALAKQYLWEPGSNLRAWLFTIMHNQYVNSVRRSVRRGVPVPLEEIESIVTVRSRAHDALMVRDVSRALQKLRDGHRRIVLVAALDDLQYDEIARRYGIPIGTVRSRLSRGREYLSNLLEPGTLPSEESGVVRRINQTLDALIEVLQDEIGACDEHMTPLPVLISEPTRAVLVSRAINPRNWKLVKIFRIVA